MLRIVRSTLDLILSGAKPVYIEPDYHPEINFPLAVSVEAIETLLEAHPDAKAIHITSPNYYGVMSNVLAIRQLTLQRGIPLIVDEAHGSHLKFHPELPMSAVSLRADIIVQSTHKTQGALTQASMLHVNENGLDQSFASRTDSFPLAKHLAQFDSLGFVGRSSQSNGNGRTRKVNPRHQISARSSENHLPNEKSLVLRGRFDRGRSHFCLRSDEINRSRVCNTGFTGFQAFDFLQEKHRIDAEFADLKHIICSISLADNRTTIDELLDALQDLSDQSREIKEEVDSFIEPPEGLPTMTMTPRDAYFAPKTRALPIDQAVGKILVESVIPYPPGVPLLVPGEVLEQGHVEFISLSA